MATSIPKRTLSVEHIEMKGAKKAPPKTSQYHKAPDRYSLAHLAKVLTSGERLAMLSAVDRLKGKSRILAELALFSHFQFVRLAAVTNLSGDAESLVDIAKYCQFDDTRASAVDELSSNSRALVEVACSSLFADTRADAVGQISDTAALAEVASRSPSKDSRSAALKRIADNRAALRKVVQDSSYRSSRMEALAGLSSDVDALCSLVFSDRPEIKKSAASSLSGYVEEIDDMDALVEIAKISPNEDARYIAVGRISNDPISLRTVISESRFTDARTTALMLLSDMVNDIDDPEILSEVAIHSPYPDCRSAAVERLVGRSSSLLEVANKSHFRDARDLALGKLQSDVQALKNVSKLSKYRDTRKKAHGMVARPDVFASELTRILG